MRVSNKIISSIAITVLLVSFFCAWLAFPEVNAKFLDGTVQVSPSEAKLSVGQTQTFMAYVDGEGVTYSWSAQSPLPVSLLVNGVEFSVSEQPVNIGSGQSISVAFVAACECRVRLTVTATNPNGFIAYGDAVAYDPYTSSGVYLDAIPSVAAYVVETDGSSWFRAIDKLGQQDASSTNSTDVCQYALNGTTVAGGMVFVRAGTYSATVTVKTNTTFVLDYGVSGVTYSINAGATCTVIDYAGKLRRDYVSGTLVYQFDYSTGNELITSANITTVYATNIDAISTGTGVHVLKLVVENGTSLPSSPVDKQVFFETDTGYLWIRNGSSWLQAGTTAYSNLTGTPDLTVYLTHDGSTALSGAWNIGGSYGIYGLPTVNSTTLYVSTVDELTASGGVKVLKLIFENGTSFPASPIESQVFFRTDLNLLYVRNNSQWVQMGTVDYNNLTNTPDLTVYLTHDGSTALSANWNVGGSYGIYGCTFMNATTIYVSVINELTIGSGVKILKLIVQNGTSMPASPIESMMFFRTDEGLLYIYNSGAWKQIGTTAYGNLTGTPDLTVYLNKAGTVALTGNWNVGGSYGIYGCVWLNSTNANVATYYLNGEQLGFVTMPTFIIDVSGSTYRMWHGGNLTLAYSSTSGFSILQAAYGNSTFGDMIFIKSPFIAIGTLTISQTITLQSDVRGTPIADADTYNGYRTDFYSGTVPYIQNIVVNASSANVRGVELKGLAIAQLDFDAHGYAIRNCIVDSCYLFVNSTWQGVNFRGNGSAIGWMDNIILSNCVAVNDYTNGKDAGLINVRNNTKFLTGIFIKNLRYHAIVANSSFFVEEGTGQLQGLYIRDSEFVIDAGLTNARMFYLHGAQADSMNFVCDISGGIIESHVDLTVLTIVDNGAHYLDRLTILKMHDFLELSCGTETLTFLDDTETDWYGYNRQLEFYNNRLYRETTFVLGNPTTLDSSNWNYTVKNNLWYNPVGAVATPIYTSGGGGYYLVDSGGTAALSDANNTLLRNTQSPKDIYIYDGTLIAVYLNGQQIYSATNCMVHLECGDTIQIVWSSAPTLVCMGK